MAACLLSGCANFEATTAPTSQPVSDPSAYKPVEFAKIASGGFAAELDGKLVSLRCKFLQAYSLDGRGLMAQVSAVEPGVPGGLGISFHDYLKEKAVTLKMGDTIVVRGKVKTATNVYATGNFIEVYFLDKE